MGSETERKLVAFETRVAGSRNVRPRSFHLERLNDRSRRLRHCQKDFSSSPSELSKLVHRSKILAPLNSDCLISLKLFTAALVSFKDLFDGLWHKAHSLLKFY
jgi:hypothetical protein